MKEKLQSALQNKDHTHIFFEGHSHIKQGTIKKSFNNIN